MGVKRISKHISYKEAIRSDIAKKLGIENTPTSKQVVRMKLLANKVFEPLRVFFNVPIYISSFFRSQEVNDIISVSATSQHMANNGAAIDVDADVYGGITNKDIFEYIRNNLEFDQLIAEGIRTDGVVSWVHFSYSEDRPNRNQVLIHRFHNSKHYYYQYDSDKGLDIDKYI